MPTTGDTTTNTIKHIAIETNDNDSDRKEYRSIGADGINVDIYRDSDTGEIIDENMLPLDPEPSCESVATTLKNHEQEAMWKHTYCYNNGKIQETMGGIGSRNFIEDEIPDDPSADYNRAIATGKTIISIRDKISDTSEDINSNFAESYDSSVTYQNGDFSLNSDGVLQKFDGTDWAPKNVTDEIKDMKSTFQDGVDEMYGACVTRHLTPSTSTPDAIKTAILNLGAPVIFTQRVYIPVNTTSSITFNLFSLSDDDKANDIYHLADIRGGSGSSYWVFPSIGASITYTYYAKDKNGNVITSGNFQNLIASSHATPLFILYKVATIDVTVTVTGATTSPGTYSYAPVTFELWPRTTPISI